MTISWRCSLVMWRRSLLSDTPNVWASSAFFTDRWIRGQGMLLVAIAWQAYELSDSPNALALVGVAMRVPHVAFLPPRRSQ